jgi:lipid-A-disaccharide synthase-like uncharacterized protein
MTSIMVLRFQMSSNVLYWVLISCSFVNLCSMKYFIKFVSHTLCFCVDYLFQRYRILNHCKYQLIESAFDISYGA